MSWFVAGLTKNAVYDRTAERRVVCSVCVVALESIFVEICYEKRFKNGTKNVKSSSKKITVYSFGIYELLNAVFI